MKRLISKSASFLPAVLTLSFSLDKVNSRLTPFRPLSSTAVLRDGDNRGKNGKNNGDFTISNLDVKEIDGDNNPLIPSAHFAAASLETYAEQVAAGQYHENKPRAIMFVNRKPVEIIPNEENLLEVLEREGIRVPKFCYHPILSVAGNCRMCMVQVDGTSNLIVSCATVAMAGMSIITDSRLVRDAREGNVELMLINHPNDCPICEQATNCDLQNVAMNYGTDIPRYREDKRAVEDFYFDPNTRVVLNRCIHCTRCVRFLNEHTQDFNLGMIGRGGLSEISTFIDELEIKTEYTQPVTQLCPVGKLDLSEAEENNAIVDEMIKSGLNSLNSSISNSSSNNINMVSMDGDGTYRGFVNSIKNNQKLADCMEAKA